MASRSTSDSGTGPREADPQGKYEVNQSDGGQESAHDVGVAVSSDVQAEQLTGADCASDRGCLVTLNPAACCEVHGSLTEPALDSLGGMRLAMNDELLRPDDVQLILRIGRSKVYEMIARGELPVVRIGRVVRVPRKELERWIEDRTSGWRPTEAA
jgi:excisionase family DNA binding protein